MQFPLVSILIPAYNHALYIEKCLDTILEESYPNKEIVIINDGSKDNTHEKITAWIEKHHSEININYLGRENKGVTATLNELAMRAKGDFLRMVASDDYLVAGGLNAQIEYLKKNSLKQAVIGDSVVIDEHNNILYKSGMTDLQKSNKENYFSDSEIRKEIIGKWVIGGPVLMITRQAFTSLKGWSEDLRIEDWDFFLRLISKDLLGFIDVTVGGYRLHGTNTCRTRDTSERIINLGDVKKVADRNIALFKEPYKSLLKSQWYLTEAKISYLQKRLFRTGINILKFIFLMSLVKIKTLRFQEQREKK